HAVGAQAEDSETIGRRQERAVERRLPEEHPGGIGGGVLLSPDDSAGWPGVEVPHLREPGPERSEQGVAGIRGLHPPGQRIGRVPLAQFREGQELGNALLPGPVSFACPPPWTEPCPRAEDQHQDKRGPGTRQTPPARRSSSRATSRGGYAAPRPRERLDTS